MRVRESKGEEVGRTGAMRVRAVAPGHRKESGAGVREGGVNEDRKVPSGCRQDVGKLRGKEEGVGDDELLRGSDGKGQ